MVAKSFIYIILGGIKLKSLGRVVKVFGSVVWVPSGLLKSLLSSCIQ